MADTPRIDAGAAPAGRPDARLPLVLLALFAAWWAGWAVSPRYRQDWLLENVLVFIALPLLVWGYRRLRLSNASYVAIFVFLCLHEIGAHYTYSEVPFGQWLFGPGRNHYDRLIHFLYGLLMMPAVLDLLEARAALVGLWRNLVPVAFIMANSALYELIEWLAAELFGGPLGQAYLGTQGDVWDAQKDSALAMLGAILGLAACRALHRPRARSSRDG